MNLCVFGAVALGPTIGGVQAASGGWRPLFWGVAGTGALALLFSVLTFEDAPAQDRSAPWDIVAVALGGCGCAAAFFGAAQLQGGSLKPVALAPLMAGAAMIVAPAAPAVLAWLGASMPAGFHRELSRLPRVPAMAPLGWDAARDYLAAHAAAHNVSFARGG